MCTRSAVRVWWVAAAVLSCGGDRLHLEGMSDAARAHTMATALCDWSARCGEVRVECGGPSDRRGCVGFVRSVGYRTCLMELEERTAKDLACKRARDGGLSPEELGLVERCVVDTVGRTCPTDNDAEAAALASQKGSPPPAAVVTAEACDAMATFFRHCRMTR